MNPDAVRPGTIVQDPKHPNEESSWSRVLPGHDEDTFFLENLVSRTTRRVKRKDFEGLICARNEVYVEFDLSAVLGKRVRLELAHGSNTGVVTGFVTKKIRVLGEEVSSPVGIRLDGDMIRWTEVMGIHPAEK